MARPPGGEAAEKPAKHCRIERQTPEGFAEGGRRVGEARRRIVV